MRRPKISRHATSKFTQLIRIVKQILFVIVPILLIIWIPRQPFAQIKKIDCQIDNQSCDDETLKQLQPFLNKFTLGIQPKIIEAKLAENPLFEVIKVNIQFPSVLEIRIVTQKKLIDIGIIKTQIATNSSELQSPESTKSATPSATPHPIIYEYSSLSQSNSGNYLLTKSGNLLKASEGDPQAWLVVENDQNEYSTTQLINFYGYFQEFTRGGVNTDKIWFTKRWVGAKLKTGPLVVFNPSSDPLTSVTTLQQILAQATMDLTHAVIDLRFDKPVITENP